MLLPWVCKWGLHDVASAGWCHRLPVTALALSNDDRRAYSVSKDGTIIELDVETGVRWGALYPDQALEYWRVSGILMQHGMFRAPSFKAEEVETHVSLT